jgi:hypothetical protein
MTEITPEVELRDVLGELLPRTVAKDRPRLDEYDAQFG